MSNTLGEQLTVLAGRQRAADSRARAQALRRYWQIVQRHENPRPDDATVLQDELLGTLGKSATDLAGDVALVVELAGAETQSHDTAALGQARDAATRRYEQAREAMGGQMKAIRDNVRKLHEAAGVADGRFMRARNAANRADQLRAELKKRQA